MDNRSKNNRFKFKKPSKKGLIVLFSMIGVILLIVIYAFLHRHFAISDALSKEKQILENTIYSTEVIKRSVNDGIMTVQLDDEIVFDYHCEVLPFNLNMGYGPFCSYEFPDGSSSLGEYIFRKNYSYIQSLLNKYQDTLTVANASHRFKVKDRGRIREFFSDLMKNADFNKAYRAYRDLDDSGPYYYNNMTSRLKLDYLYIKNDDGGGGGGLFEWANYAGLNP